MNCEETQSCLLEIEKTDPIPQEIEEHLHECEDCTSFQNRWRTIEQQIPTIPVPAPQRKNAFVAEFLSQPVTPAIISFGSTSEKGQRKERAIRKIAFALAVASALLICAVGWWLSDLWTYTPAPKPQIAEKTILEKHLEKVPAWKKAKEPEEKFLILVAETKKEVMDPIRQKISWEDSRQALFHKAALFEQMVQDGIIKEAEQMTSEQRRLQLPGVIKDLEETESRSRSTAVEHPELKEPLHLIADIALKGKKRLEQLQNEV